MKRKSDAINIIIILLGFLLLANFLINRHVLRWDLTEDKRYTVSDSTKKLLKKLDDIVNIDVYFTKPLPPQFHGLDSEVKALLDEFKAYAGTNLHIEYFDPKDDAELQSKLQMLQIPKVRANIMEKDKMQVVDLYLGMVIYFQDKKEVIPVIQNTANLEYEMMSKILKVKSGKRPSVGIVHDSSSFQGQQKQMMGLEFVQKLLGETYAVRLYDNAQAEGQTIDVETDLLFVLSMDKATDAMLYQIDQMIMLGKPVVFMVSGMKPSMGMGRMMASPSNSNLLPFLEHYGAIVENAYVLDSSNAPASFQTEFGYFSVHYPFWLVVRQESMDTSNPALQNLEGLVIPFASPVSAKSAPADVGQTAANGEEEQQQRASKVLFASSKISYKKSAPVMLNPNPPQGWGFRRDMQGDIPLAVTVEDTFTSYFADKELPEGAQTMPGPEKPLAAKLLIIGSDQLIYDFFLQNNRSNQVFVQNLVDWFTIGEDLIDIRSKKLAQKPLREMTDSERVFIKWLATLIIPLILIIFGVVKVVVKRKARKLATTLS